MDMADKYFISAKVKVNNLNFIHFEMMRKRINLMTKIKDCRIILLVLTEKNVFLTKKIVWANVLNLELSNTLQEILLCRFKLKKTNNNTLFV